MPIKLIGTIILLILVTIFAGVNLDNKCDITFIFYTFRDVPVFMTVIISFAVGLVLMLPFTLGRKKKKPQKPVQTQQISASQAQPKEESKTLFDFKIKKTENGKLKAENSKAASKEKKSLCGFGKKEEKSKTAPAQSENPAQNTSAPSSESTDDAATGAPV